MKQRKSKQRKIKANNNKNCFSGQVLLKQIEDKAKEKNLHRRLAAFCKKRKNESDTLNDRATSIQFKLSEAEKRSSFASENEM